MAMSLVYVPAVLFALAFIALARWQSERRTAKWQRVINARLAGQLTVGAGDDPEDDLAIPYVRRVIVPAVRRLERSIAHRITPATFHGELDEKLRMAGVKQSSESFFFGRLALSAATLLLGFVLVFLLPSLTLAERLLIPIVLALVVYLYPNVHLNTKAQKRLADIDRSLPEIFDLLSVSVEAGLAFDGALRKVVTSLEGAARDEFSRVLADMQLGIPRAESLASLARRTKSAPLRRFAGLVAQSDRTGAGIGPALKVQARDIKDYRAAKAREKAASIPIKIIIPMVVFIFPAMFVIILGPAVVSILKTFHL